MPKPIAWIIFAVLEIVLLPISLMGLLISSLDLRRNAYGKGFSATAYKPFFGRWFMHHLGERADPAAIALAPALPGISRAGLRFGNGPTLWAMNLLGLNFPQYRYNVNHSPSIFYALGHRTRFFDSALRTAIETIGVEQVVILGAGWDTRAYGLANKPNLRVFEVDAPQTQAVKRDALARAGIDASHVTFAAADFNNESWRDALLRVGFDTTKLTFVLWEGVTYYLTAEAVDETLKTVAEAFPVGSGIAFDYLAQHILDGEGPRIYRYAIRTLQKQGEPWTFGMSVVPSVGDALFDYLNPLGLRLVTWEVIGDTSKGDRAHGGLVLAANNVPSRRDATTAL